MKNGKTTRILAALVLALCLTAPMALAQQQQQEEGDVLLKEALHKEVVEGDLEAAIAIYERIVEEHASDRTLVAKALVQMGTNYERLGRAEARKAYERVLRDYADQQEQVAAARTRLAALTQVARAAAPSGMVIRRVWTYLESRLDAAGPVSADGRYLPVEDQVTGDLMIRDLVTGKNRRLTHNQVPPAYDVGDALISPDGRWVAYNWDNNEEGSTDLRIMGLNGSEPKVIYSHEEVTNIDFGGWSPDGDNILVRLDRKDRSRQIAWVSVTDGSVRVLKSLAWPQPYRQRLHLSPDGRFIAYNVGVPNSLHSIRLLAADGSREVPLVQHPGDDHVLGWGPDGKRLLFRSERSGTEDAWVIQIDDGKPQGPPQLVKREMGHQTPRGITRDGAFYYTVSVNTRNVVTVTLDPVTGDVLAPPQQISQRFAGNTLGSDWSPDGKYMAYYIALRNGEIGIRSVETGEERTLSPKNVALRGFYGGALPRWSPDGGSLLVRGHDRRERGRHALYQVDVRTADATHIMTLPPGVYFGGVGWSRDGKAIFYLRWSTTTRQIMWRDLETGQETELYEAATISDALTLSPDGERLAFRLQSAAEVTAIKTIPVTGGEPRTLIQTEEPRLSGIVAWTPDGRYLLFGKRRPANRSDERVRSELWRIPAQGGEPQKLQLTMDESAWDLRVHPDGRRIAFTSSEEVDEVWVMENFLPQLDGGKK